MDVVISLAAGLDTASYCLDPSSVPDHLQEVPCPDESVETSAATDQNTSDCEPSMSATVELLRAVGDGPLKSIAQGLCFILENCKVHPLSCTSSPQCLRLPQQTEVDKQAVEALAPRIKALSESLCEPIPLGDVNEKERERKLER